MNYRVLLGVSILVFACSAVAENRKPRLALCGSGGKQMDAVVALMEVELANAGKVILLDRQHINKVLIEHKFALDGFLSAADAVKVGRLLGCDVFAEFMCGTSKGGGSSVSSITAFDAVTGVRFCDAAVPYERDPGKSAEVANAFLNTALQKWKDGGISPDCRTLSLVSVRNIDLPDSLPQFPQILRSLLERQLLRSPTIALLERSRLKLVNTEAVLTSDRRDSLLASCLLLDMDLSRSKKQGQVHVRAALAQPGGQEVAVVDMDGDPLVICDLVLQLSQKIVAALFMAEVKQNNTMFALESDRFISQARRLRYRKADKKAIDAAEECALALAEVALRLDPKNVANQKRVFALLKYQQPRLITRKLYTHAVDNLVRAMRMARLWRVINRRPRSSYPDVYAPGDGGSTGDVWNSIWLMYRVLSEVCQNSGEGAKQGLETCKDIRRSFYMGLPESAKKYNGYNSLAGAIRWATTPDEWLDVIAYVDSLPSSYKRSYANFNGSRHIMRSSSTSLFKQAPYNFKDFSPEGRRRLLACFEKWGNSTIVQSKRRAFYSPADLRFKSHLWAAELAYAYQGEFEDSSQIIKRHMKSLVNLVVNAPSSLNMYRCATMSKSKKYQLPGKILLPVFREIATKLEVSGENVVEILLWLHLNDEGKERKSGEYLDRALAQIVNDKVNGFNGQKDRDIWKERTNSLYKKLHGKNMPGYIVLTKEDDSVVDPWGEKKRLFAVSGKTNDRIESADLRGDVLYLLLLKKTPHTKGSRTYEVLSMNMASGTVEKKGSFDTSWTFNGKWSVGDTGVHIPSKQGLITVPLDGTPVRMLTEKDGLPSLNVDSCTEHSGFLYVGCSRPKEGYFIRIQMNNDEVKMLASSSRKEKKSDLDDCQPYWLHTVLHDKKNDSLILVTEKRRVKDKVLLWESQYNKSTFWTYQLQDGKIEPVYMRYGSKQLPLSMEHPVESVRLLADGQWVYQLYDVYFFLINADISKRTDLASARSTRARFKLCKLDTGKRHTDGLILFDDMLFVSSKHRNREKSGAPWEANWRVYSRNAAGKSTWSIVSLLDNKTPFMLRLYQNKIVACTESSVWMLTGK